MKNVLVEIVADFALLMEFAGEDEVSLETSTRALETLGWQLKKLDADERDEFIAAIRAEAKRRAAPGEREFLLGLPEAAGLID
jgi:hypothetical protein